MFPVPEATTVISSREMGSLRTTGFENVFMAPLNVLRTDGWSVIDFMKGYCGRRDDAIPDR